MKKSTFTFLLFIFSLSLIFAQTEKVSIYPYTELEGKGAYVEEITKVVINSFELDKESCMFHRSSVKVITNGKNITSLVVYLMYKDRYAVEIAKLFVDENFNSTKIIRNYVESEEDFKDVITSNEKATCPDETVDIVFSSMETGIPTAMSGLDGLQQTALNVGLNVKVLRGSAENSTAIKNWLACNNLKLFGRIGHGLEHAIVVYDGQMDYTQWQSLPANSLQNKVVYFNSCLVHNSPLQPAIVGRGVQKFIGGITNLSIGNSEESFKCWFSKVVNGDPITATVFSCDAANPGQNPQWDVYGVSGNGSDYLEFGPPDNEAPTVPANLDTVVVNSSSASLKWNASTDNIAVKGYKVYIGTTLAATVTTTTVNITGLTPETNYTFTVKAYDAANNESANSNAITVKTDVFVKEYCELKSNDASAEWISKVELNGQSKTSAGTQYSDFTSTIINLEKGVNNVTLTPGFSGTTYNEAWKVWIDFNNDKDFEDAGEELFSKSGSAAVSGTITIPTSATGKTRMRVAMRYNAAPSPCGSFDYGEVEDYTVSFGVIPNDTEAPTVPTNLTSGNIAMTSLSLSWTASTDNVGVDHYTILKNGTVIGNSNTTTYNVTGLTAATDYTFTVKAFDAAGNESRESSEHRVSTLGADTEAPTVPTELRPSNLTDTGVILSWVASTDNVGVDHYVVLKNRTVIGNSTTTSYNVTGLAAITEYVFTVKAADAANNESRESSELRVTTKEGPDSEYCIAQGNDPAAEWIAKVDVAGQSKTSQSATYSDFTATVFNLAVGSNSVTLTPGFSGTKYNESWKIWIDLNKDYDFEDAGEELFVKSGNAAVSGTITIPANVSGQTRMRIAMRYNTAPSPCGSFNYGEVEDYTVNFGEPGEDNEAPTAPTNLTKTVSGTSVALNWTASTDNVGVVNYVVCQDNACIASPFGTTYTVTGLAEGTYTFTVKAMDAAGNTSAASSSVQVTIGGIPDPIYCTTAGEESSYFWISKVALNTMANVTGNDNGYADYTSKVTPITKGTTERMYLQTGYDDYEYTVFWAIWIDYNQNGIFESSELIDNGSTATSSEVYSDFTVPSTALAGNTRMRISMKYGSEATPCETFTYGEVEDYTVSISAPYLGDTYTYLNTGNSKLGFVQKSDIKYYPNPVHQLLNVELNAAPKSEINIISVTGAMVKTIEVTGNTMQIDVSDLAPGLYLLQYDNRLEIKSERFIKE